MGYNIHFVGLACFIERNDGFLVALPDGRGYDDPCTGKKIHDHRPYLIIPQLDVKASSLAGTIRDDCFIVPLSSVSQLDFELADEADKVEKADLLANGYRWQNVDAAFKMDPDKPQDVITAIPIRQGTFEAVRFADAGANDTAVLTSVTITANSTGKFKIFAGRDELTVREGAVVVVANVAPQWLENARYMDDDDHFFLYHRLSGTSTGGCTKAQGKLPKQTPAKHPFLETSRGLRVSCSNTVYP
ncbi:MAG TPA: hypothetical protein VGQ76_17680 [Thermoanaerobaculia bacterium]|jgi:hypothetical protein|nr:hypothetical protein [Thermoanaerobaculia bacterium]